LFIVFLCFGSFLNVLSYRLVIGKNIVFPRSFCPNCKKALPWYDIIPVISWVVLRARCRFCKGSVSWLYPFIEIFTAISLSALYLTTSMQYFFAYFIFFSALIVTIRTDLETMLISRFVSLFLVPFGLLFSWLQLLPITFTDSLLGTILGYGFLFMVSKIFYFFTKKEGIGQGDLELLGFIGSFLGVAGCWVSLFIGSVLGSLVGLLYLQLSKQKSVKIPFGPFLAIGSMSFVLFDTTIQNFMNNI